MDEMKLKLHTNIMKSAIAKIISRTIRKKCGYEVNIQLSELDVELNDGRVNIHTNVNVDLSKDELMEILHSIGKEKES